MKSPQIMLGIVVVGLVASAVGLLVTEGVRAALTPMSSAVLAGVGFYVARRHPPTPAPWTTSRVIASGVILGTASLAVIIALVWVLTVRSEAPVRIVAVLGILTVPALGIWFVRTARAQATTARNRPAES